MQTFLITGGTSKQRENEVNSFLTSLRIASYDQIWVKEETLGIVKIREIKHDLILKSTGTSRAIIITNFDKSTIEAQNAFLKTLEEPPHGTYIIIVAESANTILPTILSRTSIKELATLPTHEVTIQTEELLSLSTKSPGEKILLAQSYGKDKTEAMKYLTRTILSLRADLISYYEKSTPNSKISPLFITKLIRRFSKAREFIENNINPRLTLEVLLFGVK